MYQRRFDGEFKMKKNVKLNEEKKIKHYFFEENRNEQKNMREKKNK